MYGRIRQSDWSDGSRVDAIASAIRFCAPIDDELLANAFQRALYDLLPEVKEIADSVTDVLNRQPHLSGAGPAMYVLCRSARDAGLVRNKLRTAVSREAARIYKVRSVAGVLIQERSDV